MACAITTKGLIADLKQDLLEKHTLDAVFSFPADMFYPGASAVACCMVFDLGKPHPSDKKTFFGYFKDDGFEKRKGIGRVDVHNKWEQIEKEWLELLEHRTTKAGKSVTKKISYNSEWCAEAYMETDYSTLCDQDFIDTMKDYAAFLVQNEK
jgi:type I restriction-modification system DNA methylase subunit